MTQHGLWLSYGGTARVVLALILLAAAGGVAYAGIRLRRPVSLPRPGRRLTACMLVAWVLALAALLAGLTAYVLQARRDHILNDAPTDPVQLVTLMAALILFLVVFLATPHGVWVRLTSGVIAAIAAPWLFELPFDLIIMTRTYPPVPPDPALYRALFFAPLILVALTTLSLLTLTPMTKLSRPACFCVALMLVVWAGWALAGFGYPSSPFATAMNDVSKILAFVAVLGLFFPEWFSPWWRHQPDRGAEHASVRKNENGSGASVRFEGDDADAAARHQRAAGADQPADHDRALGDGAEHLAEAAEA